MKITKELNLFARINNYMKISPGKDCLNIAGQHAATYNDLEALKWFLEESGYDYKNVAGYFFYVAENHNYSEMLKYLNRFYKCGVPNENN